MIRRLVIIPMLQAVFIGGAIGLAIYGWMGDKGNSLAAMALVAMLAFLVASMLAYDRFFEPAEEPDEIAKPKKYADLDWTEIRHTVGKTTYIARVPIDELQLRAIALRLLQGDTFAMDRWESWFLGKRQEYMLIRKGLMQAHILEWSNPDYRKAGLKLTPEGRKWCEYMTKAPNTPTPQVDVRQIMEDDVRIRRPYG